jgi:hypothetical protein
VQSFQKFLENHESSHEDGAMKAIRNGLGIRDKFWDDFLSLLNNSQAVSDLLNVPPEKVSTWYSCVKNGLERVNKADSEVIPKDKKKLMRTSLPEDK